MTSVRVMYRTTLDGELRAFMTMQLIKYLLYMRGQIPCLYDELLKIVQHYQQEINIGPMQRRLPTSGGIHKALKCVEATELLFNEHVNAVFSRSVQRVALVFGASIMSPREVVVVDFNLATPLMEKETVGGGVKGTVPEADRMEKISREALIRSPTRLREKRMQLCTQKLLRAVFTRATEPTASPLSATKLHVAVLAERQCARIPGFLPKQHFQLRLPTKKRTHCIVICDGTDCTTKSDCMSATGEASDQLSHDKLHPPRVASTHEPKDIWYVLEKPLPGFSDVITTRRNPARKLSV